MGWLAGCLGLLALGVVVTAWLDCVRPTVGRHQLLQCLGWLWAGGFLAVMLVPQAQAEVPSAALRLRAQLIRESQAAWGLAAPSATIAAQIHQESRWRSDAISSVGAVGLAQFMPATARWLPSVRPELGPPQPTHPIWAMRAMLQYDHWLWQQVSAANDCERMAKTLRAYNGGLGWLRRDEAQARRDAIHPAINFGQLDTVNSGRSRAAFAENTAYPRLILLKWEPAYVAAGFGPGVCGGLI